MPLIKEAPAAARRVFQVELLTGFSCVCMKRIKPILLAAASFLLLLLLYYFIFFSGAEEQTARAISAHAQCACLLSLQMGSIN
jgi:hypothetical protein